MSLSSVAARAPCFHQSLLPYGAVAGTVERCVETSGRAGVPAGGAAAEATWHPTSGWRSSRSSPGSSRPCSLGWLDVLRVGRRPPRPRPHDVPTPSLRNNDANVPVVDIDAAGLTRQRIGGHETPHQTA